MPRDPREIRPGQLRAAVAACAAHLVAFGWNVPPEADLSDQATALRIDHLRRLTGMAGIAIIQDKASRHTLPQPDLDVDAADLPFGRPERVTGLRPIRGKDIQELQVLEEAARDAGMVVEGGSL
jgi:hypothetical protein